MYLNKIKNNPINLQLFIVLFASCLALITRMGSGFLPENYLWAEDGSIFITQANSIGVGSIFTPYAGYLHVYPRLISYIASFFEIEYQPYLLFLGWLLSFILLISIIFLSAKKYRLSLIICCILSLLIVLQPSYGDVFFNITNSQWIVGAALTVYILTFDDINLKKTIYSNLVLALASLTGPFSIIMFPILLIKGLINKNINQNHVIYLIVFLCALIQFCVVIFSGRLATPNTAGLKNWIDAIKALVLFGANTPATIFAGIIFWIGYFYALFIGKNIRVSNVSRINVPLLFLMAAIVYFIVELYAGRGSPHTEFPYGGAQRYGWIPYTLIIFSGIIATANFKDIQTIIVTCLSCIWLINFHSIKFPNYNFRSYANFSKYSDVTIPISPYNEGNKWSVITLQKNKDRSLALDSNVPSGFNAIPFNLALSSGVGYVKKITSDGLLRADSVNNDPMIALNPFFDCQSAKDVGVLIEMFREKSSPVQLFWSNTLAHQDVNSLRRFYSDGLIKVHFAFPNPLGKIYLRLDPQEVSGRFEIRSIVAYCLP